MKSYVRNQSIADVLYLCKDVETCGHGLKKVYRLCKEAKVDISYINNENDFTIEFSRIDRNQNGEINGEINGELSKEEFSVLSVFNTNKNAIKDDVIRQTGLSSRTIDRIIKLLKEKDINFGSIYENAVAEELSSKGFELYYYKNEKMVSLIF